jgi:pimeloyl-ACP methyl ester carboxylesterase
MISVQTKLLNVKVIQGGPNEGTPVLLLHGWPDDARGIEPRPTYKTRARTIAPMPRGFGDTRFLSDRRRRTGNLGILCLDAIDLMDALRIDQFFVAGHDWGSNIAEALAVGWPKRVRRIAMVSTPSRLGGLKTPPFDIARFY